MLLTNKASNTAVTSDGQRSITKHAALGAKQQLAVCRTDTHVVSSAELSPFQGSRKSDERRSDFQRWVVVIASNMEQRIENVKSRKRLAK